MAKPNAATAVKNIVDTPELWGKIKFTLLCLLIYRVGSFITAPGIDLNAMLNYFEQQGGNGLLNLYDLFVGGNLGRATVFALGIMPYISASIFMQIAAAVVPTVEKMNKDEEGRKKINQWTRYLTVILAAGQAYTFAMFTSSVTGAVVNPGFWFTAQMILVLTTGAIFVMWLGEQITERGLGNGASLMIFFSIVQRFWPAIINAFSLMAAKAISPLQLLGLALVMVAVVAGVVTITLAARRVLIQIPQRTMARGRMREAAKNFIPLRIIAAGVMPIIFAQSVIIVPGAWAQFSPSPVAQRVADMFQPGAWLYMLTSFVLIVAFTYFYTSIIFNPLDVSENLKKQGAFIPGVKPGTKTAEYIEHVVERITLPGAIFLAVIALLPAYLSRLFNYPNVFGGTSLLIVVGVALDTLAQMQQHLLLRKYDGFMKKGRVRFRGRQPTGGGF
jgi:preprotein translocase subunit SecY